MAFAVVCIVAFVASGLTLYSGFGLGTVLLAAFALFFPAPVAVAATAIVHLLTNLFKGILVRSAIDWPTVVRFGLPAIPAAIGGAWLLARLGETPRLFLWTVGNRTFGPTGASATVGALMIAFAVLELMPWFQRLAAPRRLMPLGGILSGFFGGLTGQQGALRSMFLLKSGLEPARFIATGVMIAILVDLSRLPTYLSRFVDGGIAIRSSEVTLVIAATASAFCGAFLGARYVRKITVGVIRAIVAVAMSLIGASLIAGLIGV